MLFQQVSMVSLDIESLVRMLMETFAASIAHVRVYDSCDRTTFLELFDAGKPMARLLNDDVINALQTFANRLPVVTPPDDARVYFIYFFGFVPSPTQLFHCRRTMNICELYSSARLTLSSGTLPTSMASSSM